ncbi:MAG: LicD family protein [Lachnospiraceae bacterium]|nr:LicD family protein [Lachnospiraceae bacterium]
MFKQFNFLSDILCRVAEAAKKNNTNKIRWVGAHAGIPLLRSELAKCGIDDFKVMDNNVAFHGESIPVFDDFLGLKKLTIEKVSYDVVNESDAIFLLCNTHGKEITEQLVGLGVDSERVIDLYDMQTEWMNEVVLPATNGLHLLTGRELQLWELAILKEFKRFCNEHNLRYYLAAGSLLGAVRHKGFIPWDDDIDIFMPYEDYRKLVEIYPDNDRYQLLDWTKDSDYRFQFPKLIDNSTYLVHKCIFGYCIMGCCIDVFPLVGFPNGKEEIERKHLLHDNNAMEWRSYAALMNTDRDRSITGRERIVASNTEYSFYSSDRIGEIQNVAFTPWTVSKECFAEPKEMLFEDDYFSVPSNPEEYLINHYGKDYMQLPPEEKRRMHPYPTWVL